VNELKEKKKVFEIQKERKTYPNQILFPWVSYIVLQKEM